MAPKFRASSPRGAVIVALCALALLAGAYGIFNALQSSKSVGGAAAGFEKPLPPGDSPPKVPVPRGAMGTLN